MRSYPWLLVLVAFLLSGATTLLLVPRVVSLARRLGAIDSRHEPGPGPEPTPRLGGAAIIAGAGLGTALALMLLARPWLAQISLLEVTGFVAGGGLVFLLGVLDDVSRLSARTKLIVQAAAALLVVLGSGWRFESVRGPLLGEIDLGPWGIALSVLWIVGITNAVNLIDGLDGLAAGIAAIIAASIGVLAVLQGGQPATLLFCAALTGACLAFLRHNWEPARIFMGDSGSQTLGFVLAVLTLRSSLKSPAAVAVLVPILALGLPAIDTLLVMGLRFFWADGKSLAGRTSRMFQPDRAHLHHLLAGLARKRSQVVVVLYVLAATFSLMALLVAVSGSYRLGLGLLAVEIVAVALIRRAGWSERAREAALIRRGEARLRLSALDESVTAGAGQAAPADPA